jgi:predicted amidophosphoribosyltransferase
MVYKDDDVICKDCQNSVPLLTGSCEAYDFCDGCGESMPVSMMTEYGLYTLCDSCDGDNDIRMVVNGGYDA